MLMIPLNCSNGDFDLIVVLEDENIARMKQHDPAEILWKQFPFSTLRPKTIQIAYATPDEARKISELAQSGNIAEVVKLVASGWKFRPEAGDHDFGPVSMMKKSD